MSSNAVVIEFLPRNVRVTLLGPENDGHYHILYGGKHWKFEEKTASLEPVGAEHAGTSFLAFLSFRAYNS